MDELLYHTDLIVREVSELFHTLEEEPTRYEFIEREILSRISAISANCEKLDMYVYKKPINDRPMAKMKVDQLKYDYKHMQASLRNVQERRQRREQEMAERESLLTRRFGPGHDTQINVDFLAQEQNSLHNSHRNVDEMIHTGSNILDTLKYNRETLKGAHRRIIDLANTLGLSNATISLIERRVAQDKYILFGGMFVTVAVVVLVIIYLI